MYKTQWHHALVLVAGVQAMTLFTPRATGPSSIDLTPPSPMPTEPINHGFARRYKTWFGPASDCGYWGDSGIYGCDDNYACRFHSSHADYPGMMGCCPKGPAGPCNGFFSTCYGHHEILKTPSLLSSTDDFFVMFCTKDDSPYCLRWTWPEIGVSAFECTSFTLSETATINSLLTHTDVAGFGRTAVFVVSISWIEDAELVTRLNFKPPKPTSSQSSRSTATNMSKSSSGPSPILVGAVVGSVVGGLAALSASMIILWMLRKGRRFKDKIVLNEQSAARGVSHNLGPVEQACPHTKRNCDGLDGNSVQ
ncbi:hypothetical protein BDV38DRAFT_282737 [Aspergillus pseudotamarii]|uniref:Uncharacterized protein n=1 Tax=Aspergillus pseudotamarii TaxID=132259 RepID=A0A5N6SSZ2_ASPPS|nr:uncharacterized protein BDV38DRAFT_282737 [Aspergillus pseudotamarii]KAE8137806.1 hypothetical protein BDV38DRAFT_282737 [Aspergillus pseudotamarii]